MDLSAFLTNPDTILLDGAMGTQLALRGLNMGGQTNQPGCGFGYT
jgi:methionine synthase I (cobalamin-dependent)